MRTPRGAGRRPSLETARWAGKGSVGRPRLSSGPFRRCRRTRTASRRPDAFADAGGRPGRRLRRPALHENRRHRQQARSDHQENGRGVQHRGAGGRQGQHHDLSQSRIEPARFREIAIYERADLRMPATAASSWPSVVSDGRASTAFGRLRGPRRKGAHLRAGGAAAALGPAAGLPGGTGDARARRSRAVVSSAVPWALRLDAYGPPDQGPPPSGERHRCRKPCASSTATTTRC